MANWIDKAIGYVAPMSAVRREQARAALAHLRAYDAAKTGRRTDGWRSSGASANAEVNPSAANARNRMRELVRNNPYANKAINILTAKKIGTGIRARPDAGAKPAWEEFVENCDFEGQLDFYGIQAMLARAADESGEVLVRRVRGTEGRVPLKLQVLEADYLDSSKFGPLSNGNYAIAGVEIDRLGRRQAYWMFDQHPGESLMLPRSLQSKRFEASEIVHLYEKLRPGQLRGIPRLAASMLRLRDHDDWRDAVMMQKKIQACFAAFVIGGSPNRPLGNAATDATTGERTETMSPGMIDYIPLGTDVKFASPSPVGDGGEFSVAELHAIAAGGGLTYEQLTGDISRVNYSSIRSGMGDFKDMVEMWRWLTFIPMAMRPIWGWAMEAAWTAGNIRSPRYAVARWTPPAWPYVNPVDDIKAAKEEIRGGIQSLSEKIRERGYDPDEVFEEIAKERGTLAEKKIVVDTDAAVSNKAAPAVDGAAEPAKDDGGDKQDKSKDKKESAAE